MPKEDQEIVQKSKQQVLKEQVFSLVKAGDAQGLGQALIGIDTLLTGHVNQFGRPGDAMYEDVMRSAAELIRDFKDGPYASLVFYLSDGGMSRLGILCDGETIQIEPTSNSMSKVKTAWEALANSF